MIDILEIRAAIESDLADLLGTYTFEGGETAIAVRAETGEPDDELPAGTRIEGTEIVIARLPNVEISQMMSNTYSVVHYASIIVKLWGGGDLIDVVSRTLDCLNAIDDITLRSGPIPGMLPLKKLNNIASATITVFAAEMAR